MLSHLWRLITAQLAFDMRAGWNSIARAAGSDATDEDARLVMRQRTMRVARVAEDVDHVDRLCQIFARMSGLSSDLHIKGDVGCASRNHRAWLECIIEYNAIAYLPGGWIERACANQPNLFLYSEHRYNWRVRQPASDNLSQNLQHNGDASRVVRAEIGAAIAVHNAIAYNRLVPTPRRHAVHVRVQHEWFALAREQRDQVVDRVYLCNEAEAGKPLFQVCANMLFLSRRAANANEFNKRLCDLIERHGMILSILRATVPDQLYQPLCLI